MLQRSLADLSTQIEKLKARDQQLQQQLENMLVNYDQRLERLERAAGPQAPPRGRSDAGRQWDGVFGGTRLPTYQPLEARAWRLTTARRLLMF